MSADNSPPPTPSSPSTRRASFAPGQKISDLFGRSPGSTGTTVGPSAYPGPIATAAANAQAHQRRRMSISTLGLSGSPTQTSPFSSRPRQESISSSSSAGAADHESAIEDGDAITSPSTPFARRMSFGAKAIRDVRGGTGNFNGDGFNWSDQLRSRAQRSASITSPSTTGPMAVQDHGRAASIATAAPAKSPPKVSKAPDHFQERILKGDFYMD